MNVLTKNQNLIKLISRCFCRYGGSGSKSPVPVVYMGSSGSNDSLLMAPPMGGGAPRCTARAAQTDLSREEIASLESKSNHDLEQRDLKIDELQRGSDELRRQISSQQKVGELCVYYIISTG